MDPVTAGINAFGQLCALLATEQGQLVMADIRKINQKFASDFSELFSKFHADLTKTVAPLTTDQKPSA